MCHVANASDQGGNQPLHLPLYGASLGQAWSRFWKKGFTFAGRSSRSEYWWVALSCDFISFAALVIYFVVAFAGESGDGGTGVGTGAVVIVLALAIWGLIIMIPFLSLTVRRLHDANLSGGAWFVCLIPFVGGLILFIFTVLASNPLGARFDAPLSPMQQRPLLPPPPPAPEHESAVFHAAPPAPVTSSFVSSEPASVATPSAAAAPPAFASPPPPPPPSVAVLQPAAGQPAPAPVELTPTVEPDDDLDATRLSAPRASASWAAMLSDGRRLPLGAPLIFGRNPVGGPAYPGATLVPVGDATSSVSKTHAVVVLQNGLPAVTDLRSTNGTVVTDALGRTISLSPGTPVPLAGPSRLVLGDYEIQIIPAN